MRGIARWVRSPRARRVRVAVAWCLLGGSIVGWPVSALTWAANEPPFILGLSWLAIILTAWDIVQTSEVHEEQANHEEGS